jgi:hypothetical protein
MLSSYYKFGEFLTVLLLRFTSGMMIENFNNEVVYEQLKFLNK